MKRTKMALVSMLAMVCIIGTAFAAWTFGDATITTDGKDNTQITVGLAAATDHGTLELSNNATNSLTLDNNDTVGTFGVTVTYTAPKSTDGVTSGATGTNVALVITPSISEELASYIEIANNSAMISAFAIADFTETITFTVTWKSGEKPDTVAKYQAIYNALNSKTNTIDIKFTIKYSA